MERKAKITIVNQCNVGFVNTASHLVHGKWTDGDEPTAWIVSKPDANAPAGTGVIESQKQTGSGYGTEGNCVYTALDDTHTNKLVIKWSRPYAGGDGYVTAEAPNPPYKATVNTTSNTDELLEATVTLSP